MKLKIYGMITCLLLVAVVWGGCSDSEKPNPLVSGTELIIISYDSTNDTFNYHMPDDVKSAALWVYQDTSEPVFDGNELTKPDKIVAGAYPVPANSMLASSTTLMTVSTGKLTTTGWSPGGSSYCFILGFDDNYHLIASSYACPVSTW